MSLLLNSSNNMKLSNDAPLYAQKVNFLFYCFISTRSANFSIHWSPVKYPVRVCMFSSRYSLTISSRSSPAPINKYYTVMGSIFNVVGLNYVSIS